MNDWLDATLKARPVVDDGFADRVIAIGRAQDRTRLMLRLLVAVLALGMVAAAVGGVALHTWEVFGQKNPGELLATPPLAEDAFMRDWQRLAEHPALRRNGNGEAIDLHLYDPYAKRPCSRRPIATDCDTGFLDGMQRFSHPKKSVGYHAGGLYRGVRLHLSRAAAVDGATFAAAVDDARALARILLHDSPYASVLFIGVNDEIAHANARGQDTGGATPLFTTEDTLRLAELWEQALSLNGAHASPATRAMIADSESVIACGARMDAHSRRASLMAFAENDAHRAVLQRLADDLDGCVEGEPPVPLSRLCAGLEGGWCSAYLTTIQLPGLRHLFAALMAGSSRAAASNYVDRLSAFWKETLE
jgi:hypothetical protein